MCLCFCSSSKNFVVAQKTKETYMTPENQCLAEFMLLNLVLQISIHTNLVLRIQVIRVIGWVVLVFCRIVSLSHSRVQQSKKNETLHVELKSMFDAWRWKHNTPSKCQEPLINHSVTTSQKTWISNSTTERTSKCCLTCCKHGVQQ
jgi:hypothetical protein